MANTEQEMIDSLPFLWLIHSHIYRFPVSPPPCLSISSRRRIAVSPVLPFIFVITFSIESFAQSPAQLQTYFQSASIEFNVPTPILEALGYIETHWQPIPNIPGRSPMGLRDDPGRFNDNLDSAAKLIGKPSDTLENSPYQNIRGAAAFLSHLRDEANINSVVVTDSLVSWWPVIAKCSGIPQPDIAMEFAHHTLEYVQSGVDTNGIFIQPHYVDLNIFPDSIKATGFIKPGNPIQNPIWIGSPSYYSGRGGAPIAFVIIHDTEEQFDYACSLFENRSDEASAQYIIRSQDGYKVQCVRDSDEAWAVLCWNPITLNIEHEGFVAVSDSSFYTEAEYESSAHLTASLCEKYNIPEDSLHIFGHDAWRYSWFNLIPFSLYTQWVGTNYATCNSHTDPGQYWDWHHYFDLIHQYDTTRATVTGSSPAASDTGVPAYSSITINLSKPMDPLSTDSAFSITPYFPGHLSFNPSQTQLIFKPDSLLPWSTTVTITINGSAKGSNLRTISVPYSFQFTTAPIDTSGPAVIAVSPTNGGTSVSRAYIEFILNEPVNLGNAGSDLSMVDSTGKKVSLSKDNFEVTANGLTLLAIRSALGLIPGMKYTVILAPGITDYYGYAMKASYSVTFVADTNESTGGSVIEGFESSLGNWQQPSRSSFTFGVDTSVSIFGTAYKAYDGFQSGALRYQFDSKQAVCAEENSQGYDIGSANSVGMWVFGDNSRNEFDFIFDSSKEKIVPLDTINWYGWKYVSMWRDDSDASTGMFKGFAVRRIPSALLDSSGIYVDDIQVNGSVTGTQDQDNPLPESYILFQNYPNPFNPTTDIKYQLSKESQVSLKIYDTLGRLIKTLVDQRQNAGTYSVTFNASKLPSGIYIYKLAAKDYSVVRKMALVK